MRDHLDILTCDTGGCDAEIVAPASQIRDRAAAAGWQVAVPRVSGPDDLREVDHCPHHHVGRRESERTIQVWDL